MRGPKLRKPPSARRGIGFIAFYPQNHGTLGKSEALRVIAAREGVTPALVALAWLLKRSPATIIIPGTTSLAHLEENVAAVGVELYSEDIALLDGLVGGTGDAL